MLIAQKQSRWSLGSNVVVLMLSYKQVLNKQEEARGFGRTVRVMERQDGINALRHEDGICCRISTVPTIYKSSWCFLKFAGS